MKISMRADVQLSKLNFQGVFFQYNILKIEQQPKEFHFIQFPPNLNFVLIWYSF